LLAVQCSLGLGLHGDDASGPRYLELEAGVARDGHELHITWLPQDEVVRPREVDYLEGERLAMVIACVFEGDRQGNLLEGDTLFARDHFVEWIWADLELIPGKPLFLKGVEVQEVEATAPIHEGFIEPGHCDWRVDNEGKPPRLRDIVRVIC
jgi:hypothetical protein